jgi:hypothetical protein
MPPAHEPDRGQSAVVLLAGVALVALLAAAVAHMGGTVVDHARARTAADAAALAGLSGGEAAARQAALRNGGALVAYTRAGGPEGDVVVTVTVGRASATARAGWGGRARVTGARHAERARATEPGPGFNTLAIRGSQRPGWSHRSRCGRAGSSHVAAHHRGRDRCGNRRRPERQPQPPVPFAAPAEPGGQRSRS